MAKTSSSSSPARTYRLDTPLAAVKGVGSQIQEALSLANVKTVQDLLLQVPPRYDDRSTWMTIDQVKLSQPEKTVTIQAFVTKVSQFRRGKRSFQTATVADETGTLKLQWFNSPWVLQSLQKDNSYIFSGKYQTKYRSISQPTVEAVKIETIHTGRIVPLYKLSTGLKPGHMRRVLKEILDHLRIETDWRDQLPPEKASQILPLDQTFQHLHFPDSSELTVQALQRLALEELLGLIHHSNTVKKNWQQTKTAPVVQLQNPLVPDSIPFQLTSAQVKAIGTLTNDLTSTTPMNRLLVGDVGSGKTVVAGTACWHVIKQGVSACFIAPTQILAHQHAETLAELFPDIPIKVVTGSKKSDLDRIPSLYVGTHALLPMLDKVQPGIIVYDEQHRFGVKQRTSLKELSSLPHHPHVLTMTATPIPRSLMLSIFSHLSVSTLDEMPPGRIPVKTWYAPAQKRTDSYTWLLSQVANSKHSTANNNHEVGIIVCPFISRSTTEGFEHIPAVTSTFETLQQLRTSHPDLNIEMLHGKLSQSGKTAVTEKLFANQVDILVTTPVIEVGLDVAAAKYILIEGAERFGLASLHQLRGRVGRAGQQAYCVLLPSPEVQVNVDRLQMLANTHNGLKIAEYDLQNRGAGNLFGTEQHGFDQLKFAEWTNIELISQAKEVYESLQSFFVSHQPLLSNLPAQHVEDN